MFEEVVNELVGLTDAELVERIEANELERRRLDAEMSAALAVAKARQLHTVEGHRTMAGFCRARLNWSTTEAGRRLGLARVVDEVRGLGDAWLEGRFGFAQATKLSVTNANPRVTEQLPDFVPQLLQHAEQMPYRDFAAVVDHFVARADEDGTHDDIDHAVEGRRARAGDVGGTLDLRASGGDGLVTAEMIAILERFTDLEFRRDLAASEARHGDLADGFGLVRTDRQRRFDALVSIFRTAACARDMGTAAEPLVDIVIDAATWGRLLVARGLATPTGLDGTAVDPFTGLPTAAADGVLADLATATDLDTRMCETTSGQILHPHDVLRAALAGHVRRTVVDSERVVIDHGRRRRLFTGHARAAARLLLKRCEHAGCDLPADWCDIDHVEEWHRDDGPTDQRNAALLCRGDNLHKNRHRWRTRRATNGCSYTVRTDGTIVLPVGARPPTFPDDCDDEPDDVSDDEHHEHIARQVTLARNRLADLPISC